MTSVEALLVLLALVAQEVVRSPSALPMPTSPVPLVVPCEADGRVDLVALVREYAARGGWSLALDSETEFALGRSRVHVLAESKVAPEVAPLVFEALLESAGFALDAVWQDDLRALGVAPRGMAAAVPRVLAEDELAAWAQHPAFEVELALDLEGLPRQLTAMFLRRWLDERADAFVEPRPSRRFVLRGGARTVANAGALVRAMRGLEGGDAPPPSPPSATPQAAGGLKITPETKALSLLADYARVTGQILLCDQGTHWELDYLRSHWQAELEVPARDVPIVLEEWLADHGLALAELRAAAPRVVRVELLGDSTLARACFVSPDDLDPVASRAATWYATAFRLERLDPQTLARQLTQRGRQSPRLLVHALGRSRLLVAVGSGRELAHLAEVLAALERAAGER